jgi:lipopolysaccharide transport system permease protein
MTTLTQPQVQLPTPKAFTGRKSMVSQLRELWEYRDLLRNLVIRDLKVRYKHSVLGILWSLLNPLLMMVVFTFVFTVMQPNEGIPHFAVFMLAGLLPWNLFSGSVMGTASQIIGNGHLIKKVYFPREVLPFSMVFSNFVNFLISLIPLAVLLVVSGIEITPHILWLPLIILIQMILVLGLGLIFSTLAVFFRDIIMVLDVALLAGFFLTPLFYPMERVFREATIFGFTFPVARLVRWLNPMASIVDAFRTVLYGVIDYQGDQAIYFGPSAPDLSYLLRTGVTAVLIFLVGWWFFRRVSPRFGEEV